MRSGIAHALTYIRELAHDHEVRRVAGLPSMRSMAASAGVSLVTMSRAVHQAEQEGLVTCRRGSGVRLRTVPLGASVKEGRTKWERLRTRIGRDIAEGAYPPGERLPSMKMLTQRYGVCRETAIKALRSLVAGGRLLGRTAGYEVPVLRAPAGRNRVVLILPGQGGVEPELFPRTQEALRVLETECTRADVRLDIHMYSDSADLLYDRDGNAVCGGAEVHRLEALGLMVWCMGMPPTPYRGPLLPALTHGSRPVAVWDDYDSPAVSPFSRRTGRRVFSSAGGFTAGKAVGRAVVEHGHTTVAFVSAFHAAPWSLARLAGVRAALSEADVEAAVSVCTKSDQGWPGALRDQDIDPAIARHHQHFAKGLSSLGSRDAFCGAVARRLEQRLAEAVDTEAHRQRAVPVFEQALATGATAWVAAADSTAVMAMRFLEERNLRVAGDVSVVGFDDTLEASLRGLASYDFNETALVRAMLGHVLGAPRALSDPAQPVTEMAGFVVQRRSLARLRGRVA